MKKVVILGGGVAGLSAAHELLERGFQVEVYEYNDLPGGKARSMYHGIAEGPHGRLPAEHGFRFFPGWYRHLTDTMSRIPFWDKGSHVIAQLTDVAEVGFAGYDHPPLEFPARMPSSLSGLEAALRDLFAHPTIQFEAGEVEFYASRLWQILTSCHDRRLAEYEKIGWWDFIEAEKRSADYRKYLGNLPRMLVAADPYTVSTKTNGDILLQMILDMDRPGAQADRVLKGPTNEMWIFPWLQHLIKEFGLRYFINAEVVAIETGGGRVTGAQVRRSRAPVDDTDDSDRYRMARVLNVDRYRITDTEIVGDGPITVSGDHFIAAMPVEAFAPLVGKTRDLDPCDFDDQHHQAHLAGTDTLADLDPTLQSIEKLSESVDWMSGMLFYLKKGATSLPGHFVYVDPPMALTSIFQGQYWKGIDITQYGDGQVADILSMDISDWTKCAGARGEPMDKYPDQGRVADEVWQEVLRCLAKARQPLQDAEKHDWFIDPAIEKNTRAPGLINRTPLLVNKVNTWALRPEAHTRIPNFFLASDYVRTNTDLATMEGANEAARRAVNALLDADGSRARKCRIWDLHEPMALGILRWADQRRFNKGLPYRNEIGWVIRLADRVWRWLRRLR